MSFSERMGLTPRREVVQLTSMDDRLRMALYNLLHERIIERWFNAQGNYGGYGHRAARSLWTNFWYRPADQFSDSPYDFTPVLRDWISRETWNEVYDLLQFLIDHTSAILDEPHLNPILEREMSGYRLKADLLIPVSDPAELSALEDALAVSDRFRGARTHIADALQKLSQKPQPDIRNAITEAVSAVESASRVVTGEAKATLADALKVLERNKHVHRALKEAWLRLYGFTSDEHGLRHAMTEEPQIDFATAKYMVVSCAAFVNLLSALPVET